MVVAVNSTLSAWRLLSSVDISLFLAALVITLWHRSSLEPKELNLSVQRWKYLGSARMKERAPKRTITDTLVGAGGTGKVAQYLCARGCKNAKSISSLGVYSCNRMHRDFCNIPGETIYEQE